MQVIKTWDEMIGKTISSLDSDNSFMDQAIIYFTDDTCAVIRSESEYETGYHKNIDINPQPDSSTLNRAGIISDEEYIAQVKKEGLQEAYTQLDTLKRLYPELFQEGFICPE